MREIKIKLSGDELGRIVAGDVITRLDQQHIGGEEITVHVLSSGGLKASVSSVLREIVKDLESIDDRLEGIEKKLDIRE